MTSIQSGMGIGEPASPGRLLADPPVTQSATNPVETRLRRSQERKEEIEGGQLEMSIVCVRNDCEGFLTKPKGAWLCDWHRNNEAPPRYTKDLEDMLGRITDWHTQFIDPGCSMLPPLSYLIAEAKALLERTGYTSDF